MESDDRKVGKDGFDADFENIAMVVKTADKCLKILAQSQKKAQPAIKYHKHRHQSDF
jgi:hypothetical protein